MHISSAFDVCDKGVGNHAGQREGGDEQSMAVCFLAPGWPALRWRWEVSLPLVRGVESDTRCGRVAGHAVLGQLRRRSAGGPRGRNVTASAAVGGLVGDARVAGGGEALGVRLATQE